MKFVAYHHGKEIPYLLGILLGLDQFIGTFAPGAHIDHTISHRLGVKKVREAVKCGIVRREEVFHPDGTPKTGHELGELLRSVLKLVKIPFMVHPLAAVIDRFLDKIDPGHSIDALGS